VGFVIDFLDAAHQPAFRVFYQDAPTDAPTGHVPAAILADKQVDVALLCVGSTDSVANHPGAIVGNLTPRYALSGHWEDFFADLGAMPKPIPPRSQRLPRSRAGGPARPCRCAAADRWLAELRSSRARAARVDVRSAARALSPDRVRHSDTLTRARLSDLRATISRMPAKDPEKRRATVRAWYARTKHKLVPTDTEVRSAFPKHLAAAAVHVHGIRTCPQRLRPVPRALKLLVRWHRATLPGRGNRARATPTAPSDPPGGREPWRGAELPLLTPCWHERARTSRALPRVTATVCLRSSRAVFQGPDHEIESRELAPCGGGRVDQNGYVPAAVRKL
jgi:hypothetical protein